MADDHHAYRIELSYDSSMMNETMRDVVERIVREAGLKLQAKCVMLGNPEILQVSFEEWAPNGGWVPVVAATEEGE